MNEEFLSLFNWKFFWQPAIYSLDSNSSFSGNGETWARVGNWSAFL